MSNLGFGSVASVGNTSAGALAQLVAVGSSDTWLTLEPEATYWRTRVERCTNFCIDVTNVTFNGTPTLGSEVTATLPKTADLLYWSYLVLDVPAIVGKIAGSGSSTFCRGSQRYPVVPIDCDPCGDGKVGNDRSNCDGEVEDDFDFIDDNYFDNLDNCGGIDPNQRPRRDGRELQHWCTCSTWGHSRIVAADTRIPRYAGTRRVLHWSIPTVDHAASNLQYYQSNAESPSSAQFESSRH